MEHFKWTLSSLMVFALLLSACQSLALPGILAPEEEVTRMHAEVVSIIERLEQAANEADPSKAESALWLDDERFSEIEDFIPEPMDAQGVRRIHDWIKVNGRPGDNMHFRDIQVHSLSSDVAYAIAIQELNFDEPGISRVTFVFLKSNDDWRIIHAHYSTMPSSNN